MGEAESEEVLIKTLTATISVADMVLIPFGTDEALELTNLKDSRGMAPSADSVTATGLGLNSSSEVIFGKYDDVYAGGTLVTDNALGGSSQTISERSG